ncbi:hypothetical protein KFE98_19145 [bacterium SCSIO 12741]|nr:hypothetical protein KFE98_19145 [bacterium SCSIO 12741]
MKAKEYLEKMLKPSETIGMEVSFFSRDSWVIHLVALKRKGESVELLWEEGNIRTLEDLPLDKLKQKRLFVSVCGKGVLSKELFTDSNDLEDLMKKAFPNITPEDFMTQVDAQEGSTQVSLLRLDQINPVLKELEAAGASVINMRLGPGVLFPFLRESKPERVGYYSLNWTDHGHVEASGPITDPNTDYLEYHGETLRGPQVLAYFSALAGLVGIPVLLGSHREQWVTKELNLKGNQIIKKVGIGFIGFLLLMLTINVLVFSHYDQKVALLEGELTLLSGDIDQLEKLNQSIQDKQQLLEKINFSGQSRYARFADEIAATVPKRLELSKMEFAPVQEKINRGKKELAFRTTTLVLQGQIKQSDELQSWTRELMELPFIADLSIEQFSYDFDKRTNFFILNLTLHVG